MVIGAWIKQSSLPPFSFFSLMIGISLFNLRGERLGAQFPVASKIPTFRPSPSLARPKVRSWASKISGGGGMDRVVRFPVSSLTSLVIQKGDITQWFVDGKSDAIVNPANERMLGGAGADGAIHSAAGPDLVQACSAVPEVRPGVRCPKGEARITLGFRLPASRVIHSVGPIYSVDENHRVSLRNVYRNCLDVAKKNNVQYIAFTAISCGLHGYTFDEAATIAISAVREFANDLKEVHFVLFSSDIYNVWLNMAAELLN